MSSFARRSLRTTAAAAGIAALGVGFAGHAFAAPEVPNLPSTDGLGAPSLPDAGGVPNIVGEVPSLPAAPGTDLADLPPIFTFEGPTVYTASDAPELPTGNLPGLPAAGELPGMPSTADLTGALSSVSDAGVPSLSTAGPADVPSLPSAGDLPGALAQGSDAGLASLPLAGSPELPTADALPQLGAPDLASFGGMTEGNNIAF